MCSPSAVNSHSVLSGERLQRIAQQLERASARQIIEWALGEFGRGLALATGFGIEGMVLIDLAAKSGVRPFVFFLDTGFLFEETYELRRRAEKRYGIEIRAFGATMSLRDQDTNHGTHLWSRDPDLCCRIRKLDPLAEALQGRSAWMTAIRREQTAARSFAQTIEWDARWGLMKVNPLVSWTKREVWEYALRNNVPYNPLHDRGYPSIGCTHCTQPVAAGEDDRAGRWRGRSKTECGLHSAPGNSPAAVINPESESPREVAEQRPRIPLRS